MSRVEIEVSKKIGRITEVKKRYFDIPEHIVCPDCGSIASYDSYHGAYVCKSNNCKFFQTGKQFVEQELNDYNLLNGKEQ